MYSSSVRLLCGAAALLAGGTARNDRVVVELRYTKPGLCQVQPVPPDGCGKAISQAGGQCIHPV